MAEHLNRTLHGLFAADPDLFLLGEDIADPYGGAFRVSKGLSTAYPDRVLTTPLSENGLMGVAGGLALAGNRVIAEIMFGDFLGLAFDQLVNFAAPSVSMYGRPLPMRLLVRCPVGGHRGYGPTHSQSPQKHFFGVPNLLVYELSQLHDAADIYRAAFERAAPAVMVEHKVVYTRRRFLAGAIDDAFTFSAVPGPGLWTHVRPVAGPATVTVIVSGGMLEAALTSARELAAEDGVRVELLVPAQVYPVVLDPVLDILAATGAVVVAEESTAGATWGAELSAGLHTALWHDLKAPVALISSRPSIIPTAPHLERAVLAQPASITAAVRRLSALPDIRRRSTPLPHAADEFSGPNGTLPADAAFADAAFADAAEGVPVGRANRSADTSRAALSWPVTVPTLNPNDTSCVLTAWLRDEGQLVESGDVIAVLETAKSAYDLEAEHSGRLRRIRAAGDECDFGSVIGHLDGPAAPSLPPATTKNDTPPTLRPSPPAVANNGATPPAPTDPTSGASLPGSPSSTAATITAHDDAPSAVTTPGPPLPAVDDDAPPPGLPSTAAASITSDDAPASSVAAAGRERVQAGVAATVALSHRTIPAAFCAGRVYVDAALRALEALSERTGAVVDLAAMVVKGVGLLRAQFPDFFGTVRGDGRLERARRADVGVTVDADNGLFVPVIRDVEARGLEDVADDLMAFRLEALEGRFDDGLLTGGTISVSLNLVDGVDVVRPLVVPPQVAIVSVGGMSRELRLGSDGTVAEARVVTVGLGYDHRAVNGRGAALFLAALKGLIEHPEWTEEP
jgi:pyruvate/2-oxoglutarate/acetoin dehydrogenase E1 component/pyruvate/2-oxoglutarate dehydrogenase complex dihydrolipoamide acyltransferase (E2) component